MKWMSLWQMPVALSLIRTSSGPAFSYELEVFITLQEQLTNFRNRHHLNLNPEVWTLIHNYTCLAFLRDIEVRLRAVGAIGTIGSFRSHCLTETDTDQDSMKD
jgi:hypothetical protein